MIKIGRRSFIGLTIPFMPILASANGPRLIKNENSVIWIWLGGGISSTEFTNPIPKSPVEFRSVNGFVQTKSGYLLGHSFQKMSSISDRFTTVRSFGHSDPNHATATHWVLTGHSNVQAGDTGPQKDPSYGSILSQAYGENTSEGAPTYVKIHKIQHDDAASLGSRYNGFQADEAGIKNLTLNMPQEQLSKRIDILSALERDRSETLSNLRNSATKIISGNIGRAFDIKLEPENNRIRYDVDKSSVGKSLLLSRRLIENGCRFVSCHFGGWDMHSDIAKVFPKPAAEIDEHITNLILDLEERGLLKSTLVVISSEFSRTKLNVNAGRDHWANITPLIISGGRYSEGLIGTTDKTNMDITSNRFSPMDLAYTVLDHCGVSKDSKIIDIQGRPRYYIENDSRIIS